MCTNNLFIHIYLVVLVSYLTVIPSSLNFIKASHDLEKAFDNETMPYECVWSNSTHRVDLTPLWMTSGSHLIIHGNLLFIMNVCGPINDFGFSKEPRCDRKAAICLQDINNNKALNLGQPKLPPSRGDSKNKSSKRFITLKYGDGDRCEQDPSRNYSSTIVFVCDREKELGIPILANKKTTDCEYVFFWKTVVACKEEPIHAHDCIFEDSLTNNAINMTEVLGNSSELKMTRENNSQVNFFFNICNSPKNVNFNRSSYNKKACNGSVVCQLTKKSDNDTGEWTNLGKSLDNIYSFQGESLFLRFFNGSSCNSSEDQVNDPAKDNATVPSWSTEIEISCPLLIDSLHSNKRRYGSNSNLELKKIENCKASFSMRHTSVCGLLPPPCTYRVDLKSPKDANATLFFDLREFSSLTHAWIVNSTESNTTYFLNICRAIPPGSNHGLSHSSVVRCVDNKNCADIGVYTSIKLAYESSPYANDSKALVLEYSSSPRDHSICSFQTEVFTKIIFICDNVKGFPQFLKKIDNSTSCEYIFVWKTYSACPYDEQNDIILDEKDDFIFFDYRPQQHIDVAIYLKNLYNGIFNSTGDKYEFIFDFSGHSEIHENCRNAAVCQTDKKANFYRDIGSLKTEQVSLRGDTTTLRFFSTNHQKCGKNNQKNVTTHIIMTCNLDATKSGPVFYYENNNCDYFFTWETSSVCRQNIISGDKARSLILSPPGYNPFQKDSSKSNSSSSSFKGLKLMILAILLVSTILMIAFFSYNYEDRRFVLVDWIRGKFRASAPTMFHYSQVTSDTAKLVTLNSDQDL